MKQVKKNYITPKSLAAPSADIRIWWRPFLIAIRLFESALIELDFNRKAGHRALYFFHFSLLVDIVEYRRYCRITYDNQGIATQAIIKIHGHRVIEDSTSLCYEKQKLSHWTQQEKNTNDVEVKSGGRIETIETCLWHIILVTHESCYSCHLCHWLSSSR